jgi:tRNA A37 methylthiotransferase MiaB
VDDVIPLMATGKVLPYLDVPLQHSHPDVLQTHEAPGQRRTQPGAHPALARGLPEIVIRSTFIAGFPARPKPSSSTCWTSCARRRLTAPAALPTAR